ncbi:hypothetical protein ACLMJK_002017 [Lecanora helva]
MSSHNSQLFKPPKIDQRAFEVSIGLLLGIAVVVAIGRVLARSYKTRRIAIDDGFFFLAVITLIAGTILLYVDLPYIYLQEDVEAGLRPAPADLVSQLIRSEKLQDATAALLATTVVSVKFSFLFFFKALIWQQKRLVMWWWCIFILVIPTAVILIFSDLIACAYFDQRILVKCVTSSALSRQNAILKATAILDIITDAFLISVPVILLWDVQISLRRKLALWAILCLSVFTMITAIVRIAGGNIGHGQVDSAWVIFWLQAEAAVAVIVMSVTAFRALFVARQASKYQSPLQQENGLSSRSSGSNRLRPRHDLPSSLSPTSGSVRTHIRQSPRNARSIDEGNGNFELPLQGTGILVTEDISSRALRFIMVLKVR